MLSCNQGSGGGKYPRGSYSWQSSRGLDLDFPTRHYIISALSAGEHGENDQLAGRSERARFGNGCSRWLLDTRTCNSIRSIIVTAGSLWSIKKKYWAYTGIHAQPISSRV